MALTNTCSKLILVLLNLAFIVAGALFIYYGLNIKQNGWTDIFQGKVNKDGLDTGVIAFGGVVIAIALFGFLGALCRNKCLLVLYSIFVFIAMVIFIAIAVLFFVSASTASKWAAASYPADAENEPDLAIGFDQVYCYAQAANLCTTSSAKDALAAFYPGAGTTAILTVATLLKIDVNEKSGINGFCNNVDKQLKAVPLPVPLPDEYKQACEACKQVAQNYSDYTSIFQWAQDECPLTTTGAAWCSEFILKQKKGDAYKDAPYKDCRPKLLSLWHSISNKVAIGSTIAAVISLVLLFMACSAGRRTDGGYYDSV